MQSDTLVSSLVSENMPALAKLVAQSFIYKHGANVDDTMLHHYLISENANAQHTSISSIEQAHYNPPQLIRIIVHSSWTTPTEIANSYSRMCNNGDCWNNIKLVSEEPADYYVVINKPLNNEYVPPEKTIFFYTEPRMGAFPHKWGEWADPPRDKLLYCGTQDVCHSHIEWKLALSYNNLVQMEIKKTQYLSAIVSDSYSCRGDVRRTDFLKYIESKDVNVHTYGENKFDWKNYQGNFGDNSFIPYKYVIVVESHSLPGYFTSNIIDGILAECLVFYHGASNYREYFDDKSVIWLDLSNFEQDYNRIKLAIESDFHSQCIQHIKKAKDKILNELAFFPRVEKIIKDK